MKIAILRFSARGDVAMTVPGVDSVARQYPDVDFLFVSKPFMAPLFEQMPPNVIFLEADIKGEYKGIAGLWRLAQKLRAMKVTHVADLHDVLRTMFLRSVLRFAGLSCRHIAKGRCEKRALTKHRHGSIKPLKSQFSRYAEVFRKLGFPVTIDYQPTQREEKADVPSLGIAPFAAHRGKIYPIDLMRQVADLFIKRHPDGKIYLFGSPKEMKALRETWQLENLIFVCDIAKNLGEEIALMAQIHAVVSMDSANMHLASLAGTPVVSIWGATHPFAGFMGYGQSADNVVQEDLPCRPCSIYGKKPCRFGDYRCLSNISPAKILDRIDRILSTAKASQ